jgi:rhamnulokinase
MNNFLAIDLGAESGRAMLGRLHEGRLELEELHRFLNEPVRVPDGLYWDTFRLFHNIREGLRVAGRDRHLVLDGVGVDTWGVDYGLVDSAGRLVENPRHYRDARNNGMLEAAFAVAPKEKIFEWTGSQFMQFNTVYQWYAMKLAQAPCLKAASRMLFVPDLLSYWLCGVQKNERTIASTSQFYDPVNRRYSTELLSALGLDASLLAPIVDPGTHLGGLTEELADFSGLGATHVYATASHDTASAVAAVPATGDRPWCYISSGTWSLMGVELDRPVIDARALANNFTNEIGADDKVRFLRNIAGLWLVQECRRSWALEGSEYSYAQLTEMAAAAEPFAAVIHPDAFLEPGNMPQRIASYCRKTGQAAPVSPASTVRVILESLALRYRQVLENLESVSGQRIEVIHIVGGGSKNTLLNRLVAEATGRDVIAGPTEATAAGNILVQAMGAGVVEDLAGLRQVVRNSFPLETYKANAAPAWDRAYEKYLSITSN